MRPTFDELTDRLQSRFPAARIEVIDDSHLHAGHEGAGGGAGHYTVRIAWPGFSGLSPIARHRLVYDCFSDWIPARIHALSIHATTD